MHTPRVAIVGGGVAGLRAADICLAKGADVTLFEARERLGGRVAQQLVNGHLIDLGANWIHGATDDNPIYRMAKRTRTELWSDLGHVAAWDADASLLDEAFVEEGTETAFGVMRSGEEYSRQQGTSIPASMDVGKYFEDAAQSAFPDDPPAEQATKRRILSASADVFGGYVASPLSEQSLRFLWLQEGVGGEDIFNASSYKKILDTISAPVLESAQVRLNTRVTKIASSDSAIQVTADSSLHSFDAAIVTLPLGVLKSQHNALFSPPLPPALAAAIRNIGYGLLDKVYLSFPRAFWQAPNESLAPETGLLNWFKPAYAPLNGGHWSQLAMNMAAMHAAVAHPTLLFYTHGPCAEHIESLLSSTPATEHKAVLADWFKPYISLLPNYDPASADCIPADVLATSWGTDDLAGNGSYTNFPVGLEAADTDIETMRGGMPDRRIWMAGEHTASFDATGTVHGAYMSGERAATEMLAAFGIP